MMAKLVFLSSILLFASAISASGDYAGIYHIKEPCPRKVPESPTEMFESDRKEANTQMPDVDFHENRRVRRTLQIQESEAQQQLEEFVKVLKTFIGELDFDVSSFQWQTEKLGKRLALIESSVQSLQSSDESILEQLGFARHAFKIMVNATELMGFYRSVSGPFHRLINGLISLNVRLLELYDLNGHPDSSMTGYKGKVHSFKSRLEHWGSIFQFFVNVPPDLRLIFETQFIEASDSLRELSMQVSS
ncbi:hypothetical protein JCM33374_g4346 [Metschnikowia sp. JCM 33374]|nr:hypothetical protein JCM33374_g4346 [Metschnikowia sp. JCM 33374]